GVVDPDPHRRVAAQAGDVPSHANIRTLLAETDPDVVDVVAPPPAHAGIIRDALAPGRTRRRLIICQKPVCGSVEIAEAVASDAARAGTLIAVHENFRFQPWHRALKRLLDERRLGEPLQCTFRL